MHNKYIDLKINGKLFPSWILANYRTYKLPPIVIHKDKDPCEGYDPNSAVKELKKYQEFMSKYLDYDSPYRNILVYHGLGSGKTMASINIYNMLYNHTHGWNVYILIKATFKDKPWISDFNKLIRTEDKYNRFKNITFISYDSPIAEQQFSEAIRNSDTSKKSLYMIDEVHIFISNVYSNVVRQSGTRGQKIYDYIINDKLENPDTRVVLLSGTPAINNPFELGLLFNLLRPGAFPTSENKFNELYVNKSGFRSINGENKNLFQRRIMGLVTYYAGATQDIFATQETISVDVEMSDHQKDVYKYFEELENKIITKKTSANKKVSSYMSYTRQSCNFVFPSIDDNITGEDRPRPTNFKLSDREADRIMQTKIDKIENYTAKKMQIDNYLNAVKKYCSTFENYVKSVQNKSDNIMQDYKIFVDKYKGDFVEFNKHHKNKTNIYELLYKCSPKFMNVIFNLLMSEGPVLVYSNYVLVEGFQIFKIYLSVFGFSIFDEKENIYKNKSMKYRYVEYHGQIEKEQRKVQLDNFNNKLNIKGEYIKIIMISPAGAEGISLMNTLQVHIMEPFWHEVRIEQMIGRAIRQCSHADLPREKRHVKVYRYKSVRKNGKKKTADEFLEDNARGKKGLIESFYDTIKEVAVDCELFKNHNMTTNEYKCFKFNEEALFDKQIGPAYKEDIYDDMKANTGSNAINSSTIRIKVQKIKAVILKNNEGKNVYTEPTEYWMYRNTGVVYDLELHYAVGKIGQTEEGLLMKYDDDTYIIDKMVPIPIISK